MTSIDFGFIPLKPISNGPNNHKISTQEPSIKLSIHGDIKARLQSFYDSKKIPHIIFHGNSGAGKLTLVMDFIHLIYDNDRAKINANVMIVNCSHGKGIKFIREDLKFFAKTNIQTYSGMVFKTILLINAQHLTVDAQSALRRCIEQFSYSTRFFIIVENKNKLLNPILSRFCDIYVPSHTENGKTVNLHFLKNIPNPIQLSGDLHQILTSCEKTPRGFVDAATEMYELGISCIDVVQHIKENNPELAHLVDMCFHKIKSEFRCEKMLIFYILQFTYLSNDHQLPIDLHG